MIDFFLAVSVIVFIVAVVRLAYVYYKVKVQAVQYQKRYQQQQQAVTKNDLSVIAQNAAKQKLQEQAGQAQAVLNNGDDDMTYIIAIPPNIRLVETTDCLMITGPKAGIDMICDEFAMMEQLPNGYCVVLGDWRFFVLEDTAQSDASVRLVVMPHYHWLFMSCKLRESITGYEQHPYKYFYEPFTFATVLEYGIGVEATDMANEETED
jgi:hypothetical protein